MARPPPPPNPVAASSKYFSVTEHADCICWRTPYAGRVLSPLRLQSVSVACVRRDESPLTLFACERLAMRVRRGLTRPSVD
jgi:hypothetical protein